MYLLLFSPHFLIGRFYSLFSIPNMQEDVAWRCLLLHLEELYAYVSSSLRSNWLLQFGKWFNNSWIVVSRPQIRRFHGHILELMTTWRCNWNSYTSTSITSSNNSMPDDKFGSPHFFEKQPVLVTQKFEFILNSPPFIKRKQQIRHASWQKNEFDRWIAAFSFRMYFIVALQSWSVFCTSFGII